VDAHAVLRRDMRRDESPCVAIERGHGKPHAASTCFGMLGKGRAAFFENAAPAARSSGWT